MLTSVILTMFILTLRHFAGQLVLTLGTLPRSVAELRGGISNFYQW
jgi:hypothetical protein